MKRLTLFAGLFVLVLAAGCSTPMEIPLATNAIRYSMDIAEVEPGLHKVMVTAAGQSDQENSEVKTQWLTVRDGQWGDIRMSPPDPERRVRNFGRVLLAGEVVDFQYDRKGVFVKIMLRKLGNGNYLVKGVLATSGAIGHSVPQPFYFECPAGTTYDFLSYSTATEKIIR